MFAVLHIPDFALQAVLRTERDGLTQPAALFATTSKKSIVLAANAAARAAGVELGMSAPQAVARCPALLIRTPQPAAEAEARAALLAAALTLSPSIEDTAPGICTVDLRANSTPPEPLAIAAITQLSILALPATAGLGPTPLLALYAARHLSLHAPPSAPGAPAADHSGRRRAHASAHDAPDAPRSPDRPAHLSPAPAPLPSPRSAPTRDHPPDRAAPAARETSSTITFPEPVPLELGLVCDSGAPLEASSDAPSAAFTSSDTYTPHAARVLRVTDPAAFLAPLPIATIDPSPELASILHGWGLRTLGDFTALPRDEIVRRFGSEGLALWQRATGGEPRPLRLVTPAQGFAAALQFENEVETLEPLLFILRRFLDRLTLELRAAQLVAAELELALQLEDDTRHARSFRLPEPTADVEILFRALHTHLETLQTAASITAVELRITPTRPLVRQHGLFETGLRDPHGFAETLARVSALVNADRVGTPQREDTHRPDAFKLVAPAAVIPPPAEPPLHPPLGLPLRRFRPPLLANLEFSQGTRRPTFVYTHRFHGDIAEIRGPWRSSGDWWQPDRAWQRLEYDIALADGGLYRLLQLGDAFFIEGEYD